MNNNIVTPLTERQKAQQMYNSARGNLLLMLVFTVINIILLVINTDVMFLFAASVPYYSMVFGLIEEVLLMPAIMVTVISVAIYLLCWIFSKKHVGWMIAALVLFVLDTLFGAGLFFLLEDVSGVLDILIHIWVLYYLIVGVKYGIKLIKMPEDVLPEEQEITSENSVLENTVYKRMADLNVKSRILLETEALNHKITYRRVKRINELVIDGYVYDDVEMLMETAHILTAVIDGHTIQVGYDGGSKSFALLDGEQIAKKLRLF